MPTIVHELITDKIRLYGVVAYNVCGEKCITIILQIYYNYVTK